MRFINARLSAIFRSPMESVLLEIDWIVNESKKRLERRIIGGFMEVREKRDFVDCQRLIYFEKNA